MDDKFCRGQPSEKRPFRGGFVLADQERDVLLPLEKSSFEAGMEDRIVKDGGIREITR